MAEFHHVVGGLGEGQNTTVVLSRFLLFKKNPRSTQHHASFIVLYTFLLGLTGAVTFYSQN